MTPGARVQAAIEVLDVVLGGEAAERALTQWARGSRYAGSKDRAAVRDHVFDALRCLRSAAWTGGLADWPVAGQGRQVIAGLLSMQGADLNMIFTGEGHAPAPLDAPLPDLGPMPEPVRCDAPDWLLPRLTADLGSDAAPTWAALRTRAPVYLRTNLARITPAALVTRLAEEGVTAIPDPLAVPALRLEGAPRGLTNLTSFHEGLWELQDAGSQALIDRLPVAEGARILDLCAGGGGKALAYAARGAGPIFAHDADPDRMRDLPSRAERADIVIKRLGQPEDAGPFDGVIADVPCSGSGSWRRAPDAKWRLTEGRLAELCATQDAILDRARDLTRPGGWLAYMTCSVLACENAERADAAVSRHGDLELLDRWSCLPTEGRGDGFHLSLLTRRA